MKTRVLIPIAILVILGAFLGGRFSAPTKLVEKERVVTTVEVREDTAAQERIAQLTKQVESLSQRSRKESKTVTRPDGTTESHVIEETATESSTEVATRTEAESSTQTSRTTNSVTEEESEKLVERDAPDWRVGPMAGLDLRTGKIAYGGMVERRLLGPVSLGAWATTNGQVGVLLSLEF